MADTTGGETAATESERTMATVETITITVEAARVELYQSARCTGTMTVSGVTSDNRAALMKSYQEALSTFCVTGAEKTVKELVALIPEDQRAQIAARTQSGGGGQQQSTGGIPPDADKGFCRDCGAPIFSKKIQKNGQHVTERWNEDGSFHYRTCPNRQRN